MKKRIRNVINTMRGNRGSSLAMVLVCMVCVSMLGVMILYMSYTGYMMKITERQNKSDFYSAATVMDEIRAGIQKTASDSAADAYKEVMVNYSRNSFLNANETLNSKFQSIFLDSLIKELRFNNDSQYNVQKIDSYVKTEKISESNKYGAKVTSVNNNMMKSDTGIVLKNICAEYTDKKGYTTSITTDIMIDAPEFVYVVSNSGGLESFAAIADNELKMEVAGGVAAIDGSIYAGNVAVNYGSKLAAQNGYFICKNDIDVDNRSTLTLNNATTVWANRIRVGNEAALNASGNTNVQDDLELAGYKATATLSGSYFGFGDSIQYAGQSSAIVANGNDTVLNMRNLSELVLAGHSFISNDLDYETGFEKGQTMMGESLSVRGNQMAYLVPANMLTGNNGANPLIFSGGTNPTVSLNDIGKAQATKYGFNLKPLYLTIPGTTQKAAYYFMNFYDSTDSNAFDSAKANAFFKDYFNSHPSEINSYMSQYMSLTTSQTGSINAAGYVLQGNGENYYLQAAADGNDSNAPKTFNTDGQKKYFSKITTTLFESNKGAGNTTPYKYIVDTAKVGALASNAVMEFKNGSGVTVGKVINGDYALNGGADISLRVVIASGNVTVSGNYTGLIIAGGNIEFKTGSSIKSDSAGVTDAFSAKCGEAELSEYLRHGAPAGNADGAGNNRETSWNFDKLVAYDNWRKN